MKEQDDLDLAYIRAAVSRNKPVSVMRVRPLLAELDAMHRVIRAAQARAGAVERCDGVVAAERALDESLIAYDRENVTSEPKGGTTTGKELIP